MVTAIASIKIADSELSGHETGILDSADPYEKLNSIGNGRPNSENQELTSDKKEECSSAEEDVGHRNGDVGLLEIAIEAQPDLVFESDLVSSNEAQLPFVRPRVYLERESFSHQHQNDDSLSLTTNVNSFSNLFIIKMLFYTNILLFLLDLFSIRRKWCYRH